MLRDRARVREAPVGRDRDRSAWSTELPALTALAESSSRIVPRGVGATIGTK